MQRCPYLRLACCSKVLDLVVLRLLVYANQPVYKWVLRKWSAELTMKHQFQLVVQVLTLGQQLNDLGLRRCIV
jgi:hypothetical protein